MRKHRMTQRRGAPALLAALVLAMTMGQPGAAEKLFDFGELNVDLSKIQAKPDAAAVKQTPAQQLDSTPESPAPQVLPKDAEVAIDETVQREQLRVTPVKVPAANAGTQDVIYPVPEDRDVIEVKIAAGSEKRGWFEAAAEQFMADTSLSNIDGKPIRLIIDKIGSIKSGMLIRDGRSMHDGRNEYQVWAPASSIFRGVVEDAFSGGKLFETDESVARSPMVFVTWAPVQKRIDAVIEKSMSFDTITDIYARELNGEVLGPEGRIFQFGFTQPDSSNSGAVALITMAYEFFAKDKPRYKIRMQDLQDPAFQAYLAFMKYMSDQSKTSTGKLAEPLMQAGYGGQPLSTVYVYENLAVKLAYIRTANDPDGAKPIIRYPRFNLVSDHPFYVLRHGNSREQVEAAKRFKDFLLTRDMQLMALQREGFRPVSTEITNQEMSQVFGDFVADNGLIPDLIKASQVLVPRQDGAVIQALIETYAQLGDPQGANL
ncbi:substrate-binding domain-containing protein [uncultured Thiohalocapsa sp.]|uniref:substrate-binding domain-containing protein n=1 Tax=uncultured Thiohalocapsa sp. TaxID=768990 RepID=UPI0025E561BC|nr:substrate-binding domain-containing protein [uncultured Thiohalocapsa sp.]